MKHYERIYLENVDNEGNAPDVKIPGGKTGLV